MQEVTSVSQLIIELIKAYEKMEADRKEGVFARSIKKSIQQVKKSIGDQQYANRSELNTTKLKAIEQSIAKMSGLTGKSKGILLLIKNSILLHEKKERHAAEFLKVFEEEIAPLLTVAEPTSTTKEEEGYLTQAVSFLANAASELKQRATEAFRATLDNPLFYANCKILIKAAFLIFQQELSKHESELRRISDKFSLDFIRLQDMSFSQYQESQAQPNSVKTLIEQVSQVTTTEQQHEMNETQTALCASGLLTTQHELTSISRDQALIQSLQKEIAQLKESRQTVTEDASSSITSEDARLESKIESLENELAALLEKESSMQERVAALEQQKIELLQEASTNKAVSEKLQLELKKLEQQTAEREAVLLGEFQEKVSDEISSLQQQNCFKQGQLAMSRKREHRAKSTVMKLKEQRSANWIVNDKEFGLLQHTKKICSFRQEQLELEMRILALKRATQQLLPHLTDKESESTTLAEGNNAGSKAHLVFCAQLYLKLERIMSKIPTIYAELFDSKMAVAFITEHEESGIDTQGIKKLCASGLEELDGILKLHMAKREAMMVIERSTDLDPNSPEIIAFKQVSEYSKLIADVAESYTKYLTNMSGEGFIKRAYGGSYITFIKEASEFAYKNRHHINAKVQEMTDTLQAQKESSLDRRHSIFGTKVIATKYKPEDTKEPEYSEDEDLSGISSEDWSEDEKVSERSRSVSPSY